MPKGDEKEIVDNSAAVRKMLVERGIQPENLPPFFVFFIICDFHKID
ncbi:MAG: hypothetical protein NTY07_03045 [Bacteroidia bacterium]|nr:hypothetical protein [Bacteroidia bacterium]